jgi:hypothetical protein
VAENPQGFSAFLLFVLWPLAVVTNPEQSGKETEHKPTPKDDGIRRIGARGLVSVGGEGVGRLLAAVSGATHP